MGKLKNILLIVVVMQIGITIFMSGQYESISLTELILTPQNWGSNSFFDYLGLTFIGLGTASVVAGLLLFRTEFPIYAGFTGIFMGFGVSIFNFWQYMSSQGVWGESSGTILALLLAPMVILFIITLLEFARGRD